MHNFPDASELSQKPSETPDPPSPSPEIAAASAAELVGSSKSSPDADDSPGLDLPAPAPEQAAAEPAGVEEASEAVAKLDVADETAMEVRALTREEEIEEALNCPCIDAMREGPCGDQFLSAYRCFLESDSEPKGMDCVDKFANMQGCMAEHPEEYGVDDEDGDEATIGTGIPGMEESEKGNAVVVDDVVPEVPDLPDVPEAPEAPVSPPTDAPATPVGA